MVTFTGHKLVTTFSHMDVTGELTFDFNTDTLDIQFDDGRESPLVAEEIHEQWEELMELNLVDALKAKFSQAA